ncbi:MAG TPA: SagB/ThcOx family dehydrogenase [Candidatus Cloacimonadota bacterium]|nr:SagB/ThcOx family dehydrogenase [Candidatus Cloacimonadota bacterium]
MKWFSLIMMLVVATMAFAVTEAELSAKIETLYANSKFKEAAALVDQYIVDTGATVDLLYASASFHTLAGEKKPALTSLERAVDNGLIEIEWLSKDERFNPLHKDKRWKKILARIEAKRDSMISTLPETREEKDGIELPPPRLDSDVSVEKAMNQRRSVRGYKNEPLSLQDVSQILWSAYGVTQELAPDKLRGGLKTAPSAGALYPLEVYLAAWEVTGLEPGYYHYEPWGHKLYPVRLGDFRQELTEAGYSQEWILDAPASLVYSAVYSRNTVKYGDRGRERYVCMDLGHSGENVYLQAEALGMGTVAIGAFDDLRLRLSVRMTREEEPLYIMPLGRKESE